MIVKIMSFMFQMLSGLFLLFYLLGIFNLHFSDKNNYCEMTYMFEYPQFVKLAVPDNSLFPQYGLYTYSEGRFTEKARKMWFDGIPVLYLPGNSGSHMQARSIASVALRKALNKGYEYHFDFFTVNFNEEISGLYGGILDSQTKFAAASIAKILSTYKSNKYTKSVPSNVILIGHSMGGIIAQRLLAYPASLNSTSIAITLASPLEAPVLNTDIAMNDYYKLIDVEWDENINKNSEYRGKKMVLSFGNGPRDVLMPSGLTSSHYSNLSVLATAVPGVWVSPDHVSIVWCKQLVLAINKFLFSIVDKKTQQLVQDTGFIMSKAKRYFQANRSMELHPEFFRQSFAMQADGFWYEDNRRIYQISLPKVDKPNYLMIRLVNFPQNRFVAIESINLDDSDWIFGCSAKYTYASHRYCKDATSLSELSRWTGAAENFGKRKLATIQLHKLMEMYPDWTHVIVKVSPTRKPLALNVDVNDLASRQLMVDVPSIFSFGKTTIRDRTDSSAIYYELILNGFESVDQAYLLYVETSGDCEASQYHVSAEMFVPWAKGQEYYHYYTNLKRSPMKLRLYKSNPNITLGLNAEEYARVTLILDPQCTYSISISSSWYNRLAQISRNFTPVLIPYIAAIVLLATRSNLLHLKDHGTCTSLHGSLASEGVKPYYALVLARFALIAMMSTPLLSFVFEHASSQNLELQIFVRSLLVLPAYMTALGIVNIGAAAVLIVTVFSSQLAHRLLFRIVWRGGSGLAEKVASGLQKVPMIVSGAMICGVPLSCGAAGLVTGAAFYIFMISKMIEEYLEDYVYKLMAKMATKMCGLFKSKKSNTISSQEVSLARTDISLKEESTPDALALIETKEKDTIKDNTSLVSSIENVKPEDVLEDVINKPKENKKSKNRKVKNQNDLDEDLNNLNFHIMMLFMWIVVTMVNLPALLTWARNFKYNMALKPDTSYHSGLVMSICSSCIWQMDGPRRNLKHYETVSALIFTMAIFILTLGPFSLTIVNYGMTFMFVVITIQQIFDKEIENNNSNTDTKLNTTNESTLPENNSNAEKNEDDSKSNTEDKPSDKNQDEKTENEKPKKDDENVEPDIDMTEESESIPNENRVFNMFRNLREKLNFENS